SASAGQLRRNLTQFETNRPRPPPIPPRAPTSRPTNLPTRRWETAPTAYANGRTYIGPPVAARDTSRHPAAAPSTTNRQLTTTSSNNTPLPGTDPSRADIPPLVPG